MIFKWWLSPLKHNFKNGGKEMRETVKKLVEEHWDSDWHDSRLIEDEIDWVMKFAHDLVIAVLEKRLKEIAEQETKVSLILEREYLEKYIKALIQQRADSGGDR